MPMSVAAVRPALPKQALAARLIRAKIGSRFTGRPASARRRLSSAIMTVFDWTRNGPLTMLALASWRRPALMRSMTEAAISWNFLCSHKTA